MPYKNIEDRRLAWKRWKSKHLEKRSESVRIQKQSVYANPIRKICSIKGCNQLGERHHPDYNKPKEIIWLCKKHHEQIHHSIIRICDIEGCNRKHWAKGLCHMHLKRTNRKKYA